MLTGPTSLLDDGTVSADGITYAEPTQLAAGAGVDLDTYALARMIASEAGGQKTIAQQAVGAVALSYAGDRGESISQVLLRSTHAGDGYFGKQSQGRYAATSHDPSASHLVMAAELQSGAIADPTGGARQWDSPRSYTDPSSAAKVAATRVAAGNTLVTLAGVPESTFRFWKPA